jgi:hypothetical protein
VGCEGGHRAWSIGKYSGQQRSGLIELRVMCLRRHLGQDASLSFPVIGKKQDRFIRELVK